MDFITARASYGSRNFVRQFVCPSVTRVLCDKTKQCTADTTRSDGQTDGRRDRITTANTALACVACVAR